MFQKDGSVNKDVIHRIQAGLLKWRGASGTLSDRKVSSKLKGEFYHTAIRSTMLYGSECWTMNCVHDQKMGVLEMRVLWWMFGHTRLDKIKNECIRDKTRVAPIAEKIREAWLRWFGHTQKSLVGLLLCRMRVFKKKKLSYKG
ncbi:hypothetical protein KSP39_PZI021505 [Platanthera zijinensis]|uniref:Reverse transcriptase n=1 Tax=Platanthera zijinensis TaxID=2320716 RepID=A0AAP0AXE9_9ASPA